MNSPRDVAYFSKNFRLSLTSVADNIATQFYNHALKKVSLWERAVKTALSKKVSSAIIIGHKRRPENLFPHVNTGNLRDSVRGHVKKNYTPKNTTLSLIGSVGYSGGFYKYEYASFTSHGFKQRKDGTIPQWFDWLDRVTLGYTTGSEFFNRAGNQVQSMSKIIDELITMRVNIKQVGKLK